MKKSMKVATALAGAAVVVAGGTAFTNSNSVPASGQAGYGETTMTTGVHIASVVATPETSDASLVKEIKFQTAVSAVDYQTGYTAKVTINAQAADPDDIQVFSCPDPVQSGSEGSYKYTWTCTTTSLQFFDMDKIGFTVVKSDMTNP